MSRGPTVAGGTRTEGRIKAGETTPDGQVSLLTARCLGACGIAPAVVYDGTIAGKQAGIGAESNERMAASMDLAELHEIARTEKASRKAVRIRCCMAAGCLSAIPPPSSKVSITAFAKPA